MKYLAKGLFNHFTFFILKSQTNATNSVTFRTFPQQNISQNVILQVKIIFNKNLFNIYHQKKEM